MGDRDHVTEIERVRPGRSTGRDEFVEDIWRRGTVTCGMNPSRPDPAPIVRDAKPREQREQAKRLIATARSGCQVLFRQIAGQTCVLWTCPGLAESEYLTSRSCLSKVTGLWKQKDDAVGHP